VFFHALVYANLGRLKVKPEGEGGKSQETPCVH